MTPIQYALIGLAAVIPAVVVSIFRRARDLKKKGKFWYEVSKDFISPVLVAILGFCIGIQFEGQHVASSKEAALREMVTTRNGPDVAFFTAVGERLTIHLQRYQKLRSGQIQANPGEDLKKVELFDEKAIYFFYGMYRVAVLDFLATKGYILYPRIWMETAFGALNHGLVEDFIGTKEELNLHPEEQAALYRYFGAMKATYHTGAKPADQSFPDLFEFNLMISNAEPTPIASPNATVSPNPYRAAMVEELNLGFSRFQNRLRSDSKDINPRNVILAVEALIGLDDYAFNTLFSDWYGQFDSSPPANLSKFFSNPPPDFLRYPLTNFEGSKEEWCNERRDVWNFILARVPPELKEACGQNKNPCANK